MSLYIHELRENLHKIFSVRLSLSDGDSRCSYHILYINFIVVVSGEYAYSYRIKHTFLRMYFNGYAPFIAFVNLYFNVWDEQAEYLFIFEFFFI